MESRLLGGIQFFDDTYNANPDSMKAALSTLAQWPATGRRIAILGRMGELGSHAEEGHRAVGEAAAAGIDALYTVGSEADWISDEARRNGFVEITHFSDTATAADSLRSVLREGDVVLVKGSRSARMERFIEEVTRP
jgi:UDP-N-acetylmuramyl pentapeptide synthase